VEFDFGPDALQYKDEARALLAEELTEERMEEVHRTGRSTIGSSTAHLHSGDGWRPGGRSSTAGGAWIRWRWWRLQKSSMMPEPR